MTVSAEPALAVIFEPTEEEWRLIETRATFRALIGERGWLLRVAPVAGFALAAAAIALLRGTHAIDRTIARISVAAALALFVGVSVFQKRAARGLAKRRAATLKRWRNAGPLALTVQGASTALTGAGLCEEWSRSGTSFETFEGILTLWPRNGPPAFVPRRCLNDAEAKRLERLWSAEETRAPPA